MCAGARATPFILTGGLEIAELFPIVGGLVAGAILGRATRGLRRSLAIAFSAVALGVSATVLSGEWLDSWGFLIVDVSEALAAAILGAALAVGARPPQPGRARPE